VGKAVASHASKEEMRVRGAKALAVLFVLFDTGLTAWAQCATVREASAAIVERALLELRVFEETYEVPFDREAARVSALGEVLVVGIPVVEPYGGFYPGDIVAGFVIRGHPWRPDGGYLLQLGDDSSVYAINAWGDVSWVVPLCDPRIQDCDPIPSIDVFPIVKFHLQAEGQNCCYACYEFCHGNPIKCEWSCGWDCPCK